ncbi:MAG: hypothetical protein ACYC1I_09290 [Acidimicrobiales bacterium]
MAQPPVPDLELELSKFRSDVEAVRRYGASHPDQYVEELFENEPDIRLIVLMVGDHLGEHGAALRELVQHPNQLEVRRTPFSRSKLDEILQEVEGIIRSCPGAFTQFSTGRGRVNIQLAADQEALASRLHDQFGDAIEILLGVFRYPPRDDDPEEETSIVTRPQLTLLPGDEFEVSLEGENSVVSGGTTTAKLRIKNFGSLEAVIRTNGAVTARVIDPKTGEGVGGFVGFQTAPLLTFRILPGEAVSIPLLIGTTSSVQSLGYAVPPGPWAIEVPIQIEGRGQFRTSLLPILVQPSQSTD